MRTIIVVTNETSATVKDEIRHGTRQRVDYLELSTRLAAPYVDYNPIQPSKLGQWVENRVHLDIRQAMHVAACVRKHDYNIVFSMSERVGIPLSYMLKRQVKHIVLGHHLLSFHKSTLLKMINA